MLGDIPVKNSFVVLTVTLEKMMTSRISADGRREE